MVGPMAGFGFGAHPATTTTATAMTSTSTATPSVRYICNILSRRLLLKLPLRKERVRPGLEINPIAAYGYEDTRVLPVVGVCISPAGYSHSCGAQTVFSFPRSASVTSPAPTPSCLCPGAASCARQPFRQKRSGAKSLRCSSRVTVSSSR